MVEVTLSSGDVWYIAVDGIVTAMPLIANSWRTGGVVEGHDTGNPRDFKYNKIHYVCINPAAVAYMEEIYNDRD